MNPQRKAVLDYARSHGVALDFTAVDLIEYVDQTSAILSIASPSQPDTQRAFDDHASSIYASIDENIRKEKLDVSKDDARFLSTVIQKARVEGTDRNINWDNLLPSLDRQERIKLEVPLLKADAELNSPSLRQRSFLDLSEIQLPTEPVIKDCQTYLFDLTEETKKERLECTKESLKLIQNAKKTCEPLHVGLGEVAGSCLCAESTQSHEAVSPLLPFEFDDASRTSPSPKHLLPSPLSSALSEKQNPRPRKIPTSSPPLQLLRCPNPKERVWLLEPSEIDDMGASPSMIDGELSFTPLEGWDTIGIWESLNSGDPSALEEHMGDTEVTETMTDSAAGDGSPGPRNEQDIGQVTLQEGQQPNLEVISMLEHSRSVQSFSSHSFGFYSPVSQNEDQDLQEDFHDLDSQLFEPSTVENQHLGLAEQSQPQRGTTSGSHNISLAEGSYTSHHVVESVETSHIHPASTAQVFQREIPLPSRIKLEEGSMPEAPAENPRAGRIPYEEANSPRVPASPVNGESWRIKRKCESPQASPRKRLRSEEGMATVPARDAPRAAQNESAAATLFTPLGSLSRFMETRGIPPRPQTTERSPYFGESKPTDDASHMPSGKSSLKEETPEEETSTAFLQRIPESQQRAQNPFTLFLSTGLLKTHVPLVKYLEAKQNPPTIIYRDYGNPEETDTKTSTTSPDQITPLDADIIISPTTGIILTTSQATTQLYLPGHKPNPKVGELVCLNSPLRERIFLLAPRYEQLYIFIIHNMDQNQSQSQGGGGGNRSWKPTADRRTISAITSLTAFCSSASAYATVTPLLIPSVPGIVGEWVLSLARKHLFMKFASARSASNNCIAGTLTDIKVVPSALAAEKASNWELFLRRAGMNPFAALATLSVMRNTEKRELASAAQITSEFVYMCGQKRRVRSLSKFIEMEGERKRELLERLVGARVLRRVVELVEQDWHCDWAVDFYDPESGK